jgi:hypothetical protein
MNQRVTVKSQLTLQYAAAGCVLAALVGVAVFAYLNVGNSEDSYAANARFYAIQSGEWSAATVWEGSVVPPAGQIKHDIEILDHVRRRGHLSYKKGSKKTLTVNDTLIIEGNLTLGNKSNLTVNQGGVLIVAGDFTVEKNSEIINEGTIAVGGNWQLHSLSKIDFLGDSSQLYHFGEVHTRDEKIAFGRGAKELEDAHASLYKLVKKKSDALMPIFFTATLREGHVVTQWKTDNEAAYVSFIVEKSTNGAVFNELAVIPAGANSMLHAPAAFTDPNPPVGMSYYRLKRTDLDENITYSQLVLVANWGAASSLSNASVSAGQ